MKEEKQIHKSYFDALPNEIKMEFANAVQDLNNQIVKVADEEGIHVAISSVHKFVDDEVEKAKIKYSEEGKAISCKRGCSFCCYIHVDISPPEAMRVLSKINLTEKQVEHLERQKGYNLNNWTELPYAHRKCVFLENGECSVYEDRPLSCRKYMVVNEPEICNTEHENNVTTVAAAGIVEAMCMSSALAFSSASMAPLLLTAWNSKPEEIKKRSEEYQQRVNKDKNKENGYDETGGAESDAPETETEVLS